METSCRLKYVTFHPTNFIFIPFLTVEILTILLSKEIHRWGNDALFRRTGSWKSFLVRSELQLSMCEDELK